MSHCKACDAPMSADYYETPNDGMQEEILCSHCIAQSKVNMPQDYYESLWWDRNAPQHMVISPIIVELEEAHAARATERKADRGGQPQTAGPK